MATGRQLVVGSNNSSDHRYRSHPVYKPLRWLFCLATLLFGEISVFWSFAILYIVDCQTTYISRVVQSVAPRKHAMKTKTTRRQQVTWQGKSAFENKAKWRFSLVRPTYYLYVELTSTVRHFLFQTSCLNCLISKCSMSIIHPIVQFGIEISLPTGFRRNIA